MPQPRFRLLMVADKCKLKLVRTPLNVLLHSF